MQLTAEGRPSEQGQLSRKGLPVKLTLPAQPVAGLAVMLPQLAPCDAASAQPALNPSLARRAQVPVVMPTLGCGPRFSASHRGLHAHDQQLYRVSRATASAKGRFLCYRCCG